MHFRLLRTALIGLLAAASLTACVEQARVYGPTPYGYADIVVTNVAPPPPRYEVIGVAPSPGYFWIGGNWFWEGGRHVWHPGYWQAPRPGYRWVPHHWDNVNGQWHLRGGRWERR